MIRPPEITSLLFDDIEKWLSKYSFKEIEFSEDKGIIYVKTKYSYWDHLFEVEIKYDDVSRIIYIAVYCMTPVPKDKRAFCLKLINFAACMDREGKYTLCPNNHIISGFSSHSTINVGYSIGHGIEGAASCLIYTIAESYEAVIRGDVKICGINPIRFYNDF